MEHILNFDLAVFRFVEAHIWCPFLDSVMTFITRLGDGGFIWILITLALLFFPKTRRSGIAVGTALLLSVVIGDGILKNLVCRDRPFDLAAWQGVFQYPELVARPQDFSFPSGHTGSSIGAAMALLITRRDIPSIAALVLALLIAFSRIYLHVHYPTDVLAGICMGVLYGILACWMARQLPKGKWLV